MSLTKREKLVLSTIQFVLIEACMLGSSHWALALGFPSSQTHWDALKVTGINFLQKSPISLYQNPWKSKSKKYKKIELACSILWLKWVRRRGVLTSKCPNQENPQGRELPQVGIGDQRGREGVWVLGGGRGRRMEKIGSGLMQFGEETREKWRKQANLPSGAAVAGCSAEGNQEEKKKRGKGYALIMAWDVGPTT